MRYLILLLFAAPVCAQDFTPSAWTLTGRIDTQAHAFVRYETGDTTAVEVYQRRPFKLLRIDVRASGNCFWATPDEDGSVHFRPSHWSDVPCRDFDYSARFFDDQRMMEPQDTDRAVVF